MVPASSADTFIWILKYRKSEPESTDKREHSTKCMILWRGSLSGQRGWWFHWVITRHSDLTDAEQKQGQKRKRKKSSSSRPRKRSVVGTVILNSTITIYENSYQKELEIRNVTSNHSCLLGRVICSCVPKIETKEEEIKTIPIKEESWVCEQSCKFIAFENISIIFHYILQSNKICKSYEDLFSFFDFLIQLNVKVKAWIITSSWYSKNHIFILSWMSFVNILKLVSQTERYKPCKGAEFPLIN